MNCWTFPADVFARFAERFDAFVQANAASAVAELPIPDAVTEMVAAGRLRIRVRPAIDDWFGLTHADDRADVSGRLRALVDAAAYPCPLW